MESKNILSPMDRHVLCPALKRNTLGINAASPDPIIVPLTWHSIILVQQFCSCWAAAIVTFDYQGGAYILVIPGGAAVLAKHIPCISS